MEDSPSTNTDRPKPLAGSKSFSRFDSIPQNPRHRSRASTIGATVPDILFPHDVTLSPESEEKAGKSDIFATNDDEHSHGGGPQDAESPDARPLITFEELPIEIRSMTERFLDSLSAKVHPTPLSVEQLSELFQEFYTRASSQTSTHIATLQSRLSREKSPVRSIASRSSTSRKGSGTSTSGSEQQMLTASEVFDRKKARKQLELKRVALEEAVERLVCERLYDKLWRHRSTDDEERDHKLRSRTAALTLVGIGLKELLVGSDDVPDSARQEAAQKEADIKEWLDEARSFIQKMDDEKYPLGKLQNLTAAHKSIVDTLSRLFPASSSADEILPTLIYSLITSPPETINVISNLHFIQRFRTSSKLDGEAAYCLVNLEAAISFLETVDLSSLRSDEAQEGREKTASGPEGSKQKPEPMNLGLSQTPDSVVPDPMANATTPTKTSSTSVAKGEPSPTTKSQRRLSNLIQTQTNRIEAASDAVRESIMDGADQAIESINSTLENSFKFLFGRLKEQQKTSSPTGGPSESIIPKTLEDARKLVSTPPLQPEDDPNLSTTSSVTEHPLDDRPTDKDNMLTDLFGGKRLPRDPSVDSNKSTGSSGRRVTFNSNRAVSASAAAIQPLSSTPPTPSAVESMRNLGNSFNPLNRLANMNPLSRFGRGTPTVTTPPAIPPTSTPTLEKNRQFGEAETASEVKATTAIEELKKTQPPIRKFLEAKDAKDLKIGEIEDLLKDYQRLAMAMRAAINAG